MNNFDTRPVTRAGGSAGNGQTPCGIERHTFEYIGDLKAHLESCEVCATTIAAAQFEIEKVRQRIEAVREAGR